MAFGGRRSGLKSLGIVAAAGLIAVVVAAAQTPAEKLIAEGHWKRARVLVEARLREAPDDALATFLLSQVRNAFGDRQSPLPLAEKAVALDGNVAKYHRQLAEVLGVTAQHAGMFQQLLLARRFKKEIDKALAIDPRDPQALRDLMEYYLLAPGIAGGDKAKARAVAEQIAKVNAAEGFLAEARLAEFQGERARVEAVLRQAVQAVPGDYKVRMALANAYLAEGRRDYGAAAEQAREALKLERGRVDAWSVLAECAAAEGKWSELDALLAAAEKEVPDDLTPYYRAGVAAAAGHGDAERYFRKYVSAEAEGNAPTVAEARGRLEKLGHRGKVD